MEETHFELTRHPVKSGEMLPRQDQPEKTITLPVEGLIQAQKKAKEFAEEFANSPEGTVVWSLTSNMPRAQEARFIFDMELGILAKKLTDIEIIDLEEKMPDKSTGEKISKTKNFDGKMKKIILVNGPVHHALGMQNYNIEEFTKLIEELGSEEKVISQWASDPTISKRLGVEYEDVARGFEQLIEDIAETKKNYFSGRELWIKGFGHSGEIEVGLATYAKKTSEEFIEKAGGKLIETMESAHVTIKPDGSKIIEYRGQQF